MAQESVSNDVRRREQQCRGENDTTFAPHQRGAKYEREETSEE
jgi:hypothetical protein